MQSNPLNPECGKTTKLVLGLLEKCKFLDKGHNIYMDNYYTSPELAEELYFHQTYCCGTVKMNHKDMPKQTFNHCNQHFCVKDLYCV